jgi:hypothetical protein
MFAVSIFKDHLRILILSINKVKRGLLYGVHILENARTVTIA